MLRPYLADPLANRTACPASTARALPPPPRIDVLKVTSLGEPEALGRVLMLWLQAFDNQPGISIPFRDLDYGLVIGWLDAILTLAPRSQYPLLAASRLYAEVPAPVKQRQMLEFVYQRFLDDPNRRWPWLAHAAVLAKHRLADLPLALRFAQAIASHATGNDVPHWAKQMHIFLLEDMGEIDSAKFLLGALFESGTLTDPSEIAFLAKRLKQMESQIQDNGKK
ncbi:MAG: hypothetical protein H0W34_09805 [Pyrinomonadaceae bacterium]|nr:hypothetical protein [Pyrinomonadaceae bacterium]